MDADRKGPLDMRMLRHTFEDHRNLVSEGMVLTFAVKYQRIHATFGLPLNNHEL